MGAPLFRGAHAGRKLGAMTVYQKRGGWVFDFQFGGERFTSPEKYPNKRAAAAAEKTAKAAAKAGGEQPIVAPRKAAAAKRSSAGGVSLGQACDRYWEDTAKHHRSAADIRRRLAVVRRLIGEHKPLAAIRFAEVSAAVQARRAEPGRAGQPLKAATINRDVIDQLRPVLLHAAEVWELALPRIAWKKLRLKEAGELVREFSAQEIERWSAALASPVERLFLGLGLTYGPRLGELFFPPGAAHPDRPGGAELELGRYLGRGGVWRDSRKDGSLHTITLLPEHAALGLLVAKAAELGLPHCWFEEGRGKAKGQIVAIGYYAMRERLVAAGKRAGIPDGRIVHGMRHHAVTQIVRAGGLIMGQRLAGHRQITTTRRYAHVANADLRGALGAAKSR